MVVASERHAQSRGRKEEGGERERSLVCSAINQHLRYAVLSVLTERMVPTREGWLEWLKEPEQWERVEAKREAREREEAEAEAREHKERAEEQARVAREREEERRAKEEKKAKKQERRVPTPVSWSLFPNVSRC